MKTSGKGKNGMRCKCGYSFSREAIKRRRKFESFAVVNDRDYQAFPRGAANFRLFLARRVV